MGYLIHLKLLPLIMELEIADMILFIKSVRYPSDHFNIFDFVQFSAHHTRSSSNFKLKHTVSTNYNEKNLLQSYIYLDYEILSLVWILVFLSLLSIIISQLLVACVMLHLYCYLSYIQSSLSHLHIYLIFYQPSSSCTKLFSLLFFPIGWDDSSLHCQCK